LYEIIGKEKKTPDRFGAYNLLIDIPHLYYCTTAAFEIWRIIFQFIANF